MRIAAIAIAGVMSVVAGASLAQERAPERGTRVVPERPARVFVMAGFDLNCQALTPVTITIDRQPEKGSVSLRENQTTTIQYSLSGKCIGTRVNGTGIYYTARADATGTDTFTVSARLGAETATRVFTVKVADD